MSPLASSSCIVWFTRARTRTLTRDGINDPVLPPALLFMRLFSRRCGASLEDARAFSMSQSIAVIPRNARLKEWAEAISIGSEIRIEQVIDGMCAVLLHASRTHLKAIIVQAPFPRQLPQASTISSPRIELRLPTFTRATLPVNASSAAAAHRRQYGEFASVR